MNNLSKETLEFIKQNNFSDEEVADAIKDAEFCQISVIEALEMNQEFKEQTEYFEYYV